MWVENTVTEKLVHHENAFFTIFSYILPHIHHLEQGKLQITVSSGSVLTTFHLLLTGAEGYLKIWIAASL